MLREHLYITPYPADNVIFNLLYLWIKSLILGTKCAFEHQDLQRTDVKLNKFE